MAQRRILGQASRPGACPVHILAGWSARGLPGSWRLSGMVLANRPWKILPSFKGAVAGAFATGAYALVIPTI